MKKLFTLEVNLYDPGDMHSDYGEFSTINDIAYKITDCLIKFISTKIVHEKRNVKKDINYPIFVDNNALSNGTLKLEAMFIPQDVTFQVFDYIEYFYLCLQAAIEVLFLDCEENFENYTVDQSQHEPIVINNGDLTGALSISVKNPIIFELARRLNNPLKNLYDFNPAMTFKLTAGSNSIYIPGVIVLKQYLKERKKIPEKITFVKIKPGNHTQKPHSYFIELKSTSRNIELVDIPKKYLKLATRMSNPDYNDPGIVIGWAEFKKLRGDEKETGVFIVKSLHRSSDEGQPDLLYDYSQSTS